MRILDFDGAASPMPPHESKFFKVYRPINLALKGTLGTNITLKVYWSPTSNIADRLHDATWDFSAEGVKVYDTFRGGYVMVALETSGAALDNNTQVTVDMMDGMQ